MSNFDKWAGMFLLVISIFIIVESMQFPEQVSRYGPGFFPTIVSIGMIVTTLFLFMRSRDKESLKLQKRNIFSRQISLLLLLITVYAVSVLLIGLSLSTLLFLIVYQRLFFFKGWKSTLIFSLLSTIIIWFVFIYLFNIPLKGIFIS